MEFVVGLVILVIVIFLFRGSSSPNHNIKKSSSGAIRTLGDKTEELANRLSKIKFTIEMFKNEILLQKDEAFPESYGAFFIAYIHGLIQEMCLWDGEGVADEWGGVKIDDVHLTMVYQEVQRIWKLEDEIFSDAVKTKTKLILISPSGSQGLGAGHSDGAYVCNPKNQPPYFVQLTSHFSK